MKTDVLIIGGGPAGMASAISASKNGAKVILIEREYRLGGILNQCIHNGFGLHYFGEELSGPEYAHKLIDKLKECKNINIKLESAVTKITKNEKNKFVVQITSPDGLQKIVATSIILALGCRERPAGAINLAGSRVAGIFSAGAAQAIVNLQGKMIGKNIVILGSGDIGLIMARRLVCEGANVLGVYEIMPTCGGLARNVTQCLEDFDIPLFLNTTVTKVLGKKRVTGVMVAPMKNGIPDKTNERLIKCDTLLLSVGLIPEIELVKNMNIEKQATTNSFAVDEYLQTNINGLFIAGNVLHVNDLVDNVTIEGECAGKNASMYAQNKLINTKKIELIVGNGIKYTIPKYIYTDNNEQLLTISFRVNKKFENVSIQVISNKEIILNKPCTAINPSEMQVIKVLKSKIKNDLSIQII